MNPSHIVIHHTGAEEKDARQVRAYHLSLGWRDVGYNYIIESSGKVVSGRSLDIPGAHTRADGMNRKSIGIALIGNFELNYPSYQQIVSLKELVAGLSRDYSISKENILFHRQVKGARTLCPGKNFPEICNIFLDHRTYA